MTELRQLTGARGIAAWAVVLYHLRLSIDGLPAPALAVFAKGYLAVDFFFLLSGFVIWLAWHHRLPAERIRFWQKRIARIWPLHLLMLGVAVTLAAAQAMRGVPDPAFPWAELPLHLLLVQQWGTTSALHWNDPAWSISAELAAYLLFPLLVRLVDWRRWSTPALVVVIAAVLAILPLAMGGGTLGHDIPRFGVLRCLCEFAAGTALAAFYLRGGTVRAPLAIAGLCVAALFAGAPETLAVAPLFAALLLALARGHARLLASRPIHWLGEISYATYLSHFLLWKLAKLALPAGPQPPVVIAAYLLTVLLVSHLLYRWWELPAQRWLNARPLPGRNERGPRHCPAMVALVYSDDSKPGITRKKVRNGWGYYSADGERITDREEIDRLNAIGLPPAYTDAWFNPKPHGHIQAVGWDEKGRKQYRYHLGYREAQDAAKYEKTAEFGRALPKLREQVAADLARRDLGKERAVAAVVRLLDTSHIRVGNEEYADTNNSYGATTLRTKHGKVSGHTLKLCFKAKSGKQCVTAVTDRGLARFVKACQDLDDQHLFAWLDDAGEAHPVTSSDVNAYIKAATGGDFTAKNFRTWGASLLAFEALATCERPLTLKQMLEPVTQRLGNTPAIARKSYVHPTLVALVKEGQAAFREELRLPRAAGGLSREERGLIAFLEAQVVPAARVEARRASK